MLFKSIKDQGGITVKLDDERGLHNGFGWREFDTFARLYEADRLPLASLAELMNVGSVNTIKNWLHLRIEEIELNS